MNYTQRMPDDFHVHFREGAMLEQVATYTARSFGRALVMPNLSIPITSAGHLESYRAAIRQAAPLPFVPLMTFYANEDVSPESVRELKEAGAVAGKYYPKGVTTGSEAGASDIERLYPLFAAMEEHGLVLCLHGEQPGVFCLDREEEFLRRSLLRLSRKFPRLRNVLEHITTANAASWVRMLDNVAATITVHHLYLTLDDVIGDKINPHAFCKPIAKREEDRQALIEAAASGNPKFFFGSDSAPHTKGTKECASGCAGIFSAPCAMESLLEIFSTEGKIEKLENFTATFGAKFYGLPLNTQKVSYARMDWTFDNEVVGIIPFRAGQKMRWHHT